MRVIRARNVQQAIPEALHQLRSAGVVRNSRNGPVIVFPEPVVTVYERPDERVVFWPARDANPFFHLIESLWMLDGRDDVETVARYVQRMREFSDNGRTFHGAYGYRWRHHFGADQLAIIIDGLKADKDDRRQVLSMWDARADLIERPNPARDIPCNLQAIFQVSVDGRLDMTITNRSNDLVWGAYGANAVHFSYLHEYVARCAGIPLGVYRQISINLHVYTAVLPQVIHLADEAPSGAYPPAFHWVSRDPYTAETVTPYPLMSVDPDKWRADLDMFFENPYAMGFHDPFFRRVAIPMALAHTTFKQTSPPERYKLTRAALANVQATDWKRAALEWVDRREHNAQVKAEAKKRAEDDGVAYE